MRGQSDALVLIAPDKNSVAVLDAILGSSGEVMALDVLPVPTQPLNCINKHLILFVAPFTAI
jgi:hypothetical protein